MVKYYFRFIELNKLLKRLELGKKCCFGEADRHPQPFPVNGGRGAEANRPQKSRLAGQVKTPAAATLTRVRKIALADLRGWV